MDDGHRMHRVRSMNKVREVIANNITSSQHSALVSHQLKQESYTMTYLNHPTTPVVLVGGGYPYSIIALDPVTLKKSYTFKGHKNTVRCLKSFRDTHAVTASADGTIRLWSGTTREMVSLYKTELMFEMNTCCGVDSTSAMVWGGGADMKLYAWEVETGSLLHHYNAGTNAVGITCVKPLSNPYLLLAGCKSGEILIYDVRLPPDEAKVGIFEGHDGSVSTVALHPDSSAVLTGSYDGSVRLWHEEDGNMESISSISGFKGLVREIEICKDIMAVCSVSRSLRLVSINTEARVASFDHNGWVNSCAFSPDGRYLYSVCSGNDVMMWNMAPVYQAQKEADEFASLLTNVNSTYVESAGISPSSRYRKMSLRDIEPDFSAFDMENEELGKTGTPANLSLNSRTQTPSAIDEGKPSCGCGATTCECKKKLDAAMVRIAELEAQLASSSGTTRGIAGGLKATITAPMFEKSPRGSETSKRNLNNTTTSSNAGDTRKSSVSFSELNDVRP
eukprot:PhF_6_TR14979/c0_g1_i3/m.23540